MGTATYILYPGRHIPEYSIRPPGHSRKAYCLLHTRLLFLRTRTRWDSSRPVPTPCLVLPYTPPRWGSSCWGSRCLCNCLFPRGKTNLSFPAPPRPGGGAARPSLRLLRLSSSTCRPAAQRLVLDRAPPRRWSIGVGRLALGRTPGLRWRVSGRAVGWFLARRRSSGGRTSRLRLVAFSVWLSVRAHSVLRIFAGLSEATGKVEGDASCAEMMNQVVLVKLLRNMCKQ